MGEIIFDFKCYYATEDECIERINCQESLKRLGLEQEEMEKRILDCSNCYLRGRCIAKTGNTFSGVKTC